MTDITVAGQTAFYVRQLGADIAEKGTMAPAVEAAAALGLVIAAGVDLAKDGDRVLTGVVQAMTEAFSRAKGNDELRASAATLVSAEVKERKQEAATETHLAAMHLKVKAGTPDHAMRKALAVLKSAGIEMTGLMAFAEDGTMLHSEGDIAENMIPPGAKAPGNVQKH